MPVQVLVAVNTDNTIISTTSRLLRNKPFFRFSFGANIFYRDSFISPDRLLYQQTKQQTNKTPLGTHFNPPSSLRGGGPASLCCNALFGVGSRWLRSESCIYTHTHTHIYIYIYISFLISSRENKKVSHQKP